MAEIMLITRPISPPWDEGSKKLAWQLASELDEHNFHLLTSDSRDILNAPAHIRFREVYSSKELNRIQQLRLLWFLVSGREMAPIDIFHTLFVPSLITSFVLKNISGMRHRPSIQTVPSLYQGVRKADVKKLFFSDHIVTLSDWTAGKLRSFGIDNVTKINAGLDLREFLPDENVRVSRADFGFQDDDILVLYSGELTRLGSLEMILDIIPGVLAKSKNIKFVIACPTRLEADKRARRKAIEHVDGMGYSDRVIFLGDVKTFSGLLNACDIFLYPVNDMSRKIDTPLTVLEALAMKLPVILTDLPPLNEIMRDEIGMAINQGDRGSFVSAVLKLAKNPPLRHKMGEKGRNVVVKYYSLSRMVEQYRKLYHELNY